MSGSRIYVAPVPPSRIRGRLISGVKRPSEKTGKYNPDHCVGLR